MRAIPLTLLALTACWKTDIELVPDETVPFTPEVGAPEGWVVQGFEMDLTCPSGEAARFYMVYPEDARAPAGEEPTLALPLAIIFHSGSFDFVRVPEAGDPLSGQSFQEDQTGTKRLSASWAFTHVFTTLGLYPNYDPVEIHAGTLPAALAEKGIAMMLPTNCWGDFWHNRGSLADNNILVDRFERNGRTAAEFAWLHATEEFPPGNPVELPILVDTDRIYMIGLGEGARAVTELLSLGYPNGEGQLAYPYRRTAGVVLDSPYDDLSVYWRNTGAAAAEVQSGLLRIFTGGETTVGPGSLSDVPDLTFPSRVGLLYSTNDTRLPNGILDPALERMAEENTGGMWVHESIAQEHVLTNANPELAKAVADYLVEGVSALDPGLVDGP